MTGKQFPYSIADLIRVKYVRLSFLKLVQFRDKFIGQLPNTCQVVIRFDGRVSFPELQGIELTAKVVVLTGHHVPHFSKSLLLVGHDSQAVSFVFQSDVKRSR